MKRKHESGQVVILIMLVMLIGLTIGLSLVSRSLQDLRQTSVSDFRNRAFTVSESAVEESLRQGLSNLASSSCPGSWDGTTCTVSGLSLNGVNYGYTVSAGASGAYVTKTNVAKDDVVQVDLTGATSPLKVCWDGDASVIISVVYQEGGSYKIDKTAFNPATRSGNGFTTASAPSNCPVSTDFTPTLMGSISWPAGSTPLLSRVRPLYAGAKIGVSATGLPSQSYRAVGTATLGNVTAKTEVTQSKPYLPAIFDYVIFSNSGSITK